MILNLVNVQATAQPVRIDLRGGPTVRPQASGEVLTGELTAINTVEEPTKVTPKPVRITNAAPVFTHELPGHSVSVLRLNTR